MFSILNKIGLSDDQAYKLKKGKEVIDVDESVANALVKRGLAVAQEVKSVKPKVFKPEVKPEKIKQKHNITKEEGK